MKLTEDQQNALNEDLVNNTIWREELNVLKKELNSAFSDIIVYSKKLAMMQTLKEQTNWWDCCLSILTATTNIHNMLEEASSKLIL